MTRSLSTKDVVGYLLIWGCAALILAGVAAWIAFSGDALLKPAYVVVAGSAGFLGVGSVALATSVKRGSHRVAPNAGVVVTGALVLAVLSFLLDGSVLPFLLPNAFFGVMVWLTARRTAPRKQEANPG